MPDLTKEQIRAELARRAKEGTYKGTAHVVKPKSTNTSVSSKTVKPYGEDPVVEEFFKKYHVKDSGDLYNKNIGHQKPDKSGIYGSDITLDEWKKHNPRYAAAHPNFDPAKKEDIIDYEKYHYKDTHDKIYERAIKDGLSPEKAEEQATRVAKGVSFIDAPGDVRHADQKWGNYHRSRGEINFEETPPAPETPGTPKTVVAEEAKKKEPIIPPVEESGNDPWWLQDIVKTAGAAGDFFRVKKYMPWQATPNVTLPEATFYDPTRELAANAEQTNILTQGLGHFAGPQALSARASQIQGTAAKNAADILARYNNQNVSVANNLSSQNAQTMNAFSQNRADQATHLFDKQTIANQQFDNSKNMARQMLRQGYIDAVTNKNYTANLNQLYDQYKIDPSIGGRMHFTHGRPIKPETDPDMFEKFSSLRQKLPTDVKSEDIWKFISGQTKAGNTQQQLPDGYPG